MASPSAWFTTEIQQMMFGFGDSKRPLQETAVLVEEIVHQQMVSMILQANEVAITRGEKQITIEDILFLLRRDKVKLKRLLKYYEVRDLKFIIKNSLAGDEIKADSNTIQSQEKLAFDKKTMGKNRQICYEFLSSIDQTGELLALFEDSEVDPVKHERMLRAELQTQGMDTQQYMEFCQARQANFSRKYNKSQRFKDWLQFNLSPEININPAVVEMFSYLAFETVAQIVDLALLVKQDMRSKPNDHLSRTRPPLCVNYADLYANSLYNKPETVLTDQSQQDVNNPMKPGTNIPLATATQKINKKKRKKSDPPTSVDLSWDCTILPSDVREAMRRYYTDIGPFTSQMKINPHCSPWYKTLCS
ncbi:transcription initiation protein SPT3 homolog [Physella acuta]|uniref:transcription initiation protein SPT3 homolog n=1 Tax=Physella acuta TaxID=109671 RepID=UPI0027DC7D97|nr:transcription initiation protein SPT3 homolog [Physella acuta]XP_059154985.1 transcription initiation protein SPT3 homolog [Physella acuta]